MGIQRWQFFRRYQCYMLPPTLNTVKLISQKFVVFWLPYWFPTNECWAELPLQNLINNSPRQKTAPTNKTRRIERRRREAILVPESLWALWYGEGSYWTKIIIIIIQPSAITPDFSLSNLSAGDSWPKPSPSQARIQEEDRCSECTTTAQQTKPAITEQRIPGGGRTYVVCYSLSGLLACYEDRCRTWAILK